MPTPLLDRLLAERATAWEQAKTIRKILDEEGRDLTTEEDATYERALADVESLGKKIEREERAARLDDVDWDKVSASAGLGEDKRSGDEGTQEDRDAAYRKAFGQWLRYNEEQEDKTVLRRRALDAKELRALGVGTPSAGGYTVPTGFRDEIIKIMKAFGGMLEWATVITTASGQTLPWPTVDDTGNIGARLAENTAMSEQDVALGTNNLDAYVYTSKMVRASWQLINDSAFDVESFLRDLFGERIGRIVNQETTIGTGSTMPDGIITGAVVGKQGATGQTTSVTYNDLIDLVYSIDPAYRRSPDVGWMASDTFYKGARKLVDGQNRPLWEPSVQAGAPDVLLGYPVRVNQDVPVPAASAKSALFGSVKTAYVIRQVKEFSMTRLDERYAEFLQSGFFAYARYDGTMQNTAAVRAYQQSAT